MPTVSSLPASLMRMALLPALVLQLGAGIGRLAPAIDRQGIGQDRIRTVIACTAC